MINDDFNFTLDSSDFPVSIEEFAAYLDGNLTDDDMQRVGTVIEHNDTMQDVMDSMELSELTLEEYEQEDIQLPEEIADNEFMILEIAAPSFGDASFFYPAAEVAACAAAPIIFNQPFMLNEEDCSEAPNNYFEEADNSNVNETGNSLNTNEDNPINN